MNNVKNIKRNEEFIMAWSPKFDLKETFGDLYFMGVDEKYKYEDGEKLIKNYMHIN